MVKMIHSMIRVLDEASSVEFYKTEFGLRVVDRLDFEKFTMVYLGDRESGFELELTINKGRTEPYDIGDGYGHLAISVENLEATHQRFADQNFKPRPIVTFAPDGEVFARFFFVKDPDGYQIEVLAREGRFS